MGRFYNGCFYGNSIQTGGCRESNEIFIHWPFKILAAVDNLPFSVIMKQLNLICVDRLDWGVKDEVFFQRFFDYFEMLIQMLVFLRC